MVSVALVIHMWVSPIPGAQMLHAFAPAGQTWSAGHRGMDLAAQPGTPVAAVGPGTVVFVGVVAGKPVLSIAHGQGLRSTYEPVAALVQPGDQVRAGQVIGRTAQRGGHCAGRCLHLGLRGSGRGDYRDPQVLLGRHFAVLRPVLR